MTLIGVKSKYGSCNGNCTGWINHLTINKCIYIPNFIYFCIKDGTNIYIALSLNEGKLKKNFFNLVQIQEKIKF